MSVRIISLACACTVFAFSTGCGSSEIQHPVSVSGVVTMDGVPLRDAEVYFMSGEFVAFGKTGENGEYVLAQGAMPGTNRVFIKKMNGADSERFLPGYGEDGLDEGQLEAAVSAVKTDPSTGNRIRNALHDNMVPAEFGSATETKLTMIVPDTGTESADVQLTSNG